VPLKIANKIALIVEKICYRLLKNDKTIVIARYEAIST